MPGAIRCHAGEGLPDFCDRGGPAIHPYSCLAPHGPLLRQLAVDGPQLRSPRLAPGCPGLGHSGGRHRQPGPDDSAGGQRHHRDRQPGPADHAAPGPD
ncbi:unnamed protein product [Rotaria sp. Silwood1]|nr:unnamed protein product [Rotaria sp. Silwood1]